MTDLDQAREALAKACWVSSDKLRDRFDTITVGSALTAIKAAILAERERCAAIADRHLRDCGDGDDTPLHEANFTCKRIAQSIRSQSDQEVKA